MLFCMKGMSGGSKKTDHVSDGPPVSQQDMQRLQIQMADLIEQNHKLTNEVEGLRTKSSNVIELTEERLSSISRANG